MKVFLDSLGCAKNLVDSEKIIGLFADYDHIITNNPEEAHIIIVNTCGFINSAREESINTLFDYSLYKENGVLQKLILTGCMADMSFEDLKSSFNEVDEIIKINDLPEYIKKISFNSIKSSPESSTKRIITTPKGQAYLKIAEGCSQACAFCTIPSFKGSFRSFDPDALIDEAVFLVKNGVKEINLVAQDLTSYGNDISLSLPYLLKRLCKISDLRWIRLLYTYPDKVDKELISIIAGEEKICNYIDIPLQHLDNNVLKSMRRWGTHEKYYELINELRNKIQDITIRSTFIVGFPGETEEAFNNLIERCQKIKFDRLGVFEYSDERDTQAYKLKNKISSNKKSERYDELMRVQMDISEELLSKRIGKKYEVLVEEITDDGICICRSRHEAPEVDGLIFTKNNKVLIGDIIKVKITNFADGSVYDLEGAVV
jgi:ribosomal protein S12 methylthiotransferase